VTSDFATFVQLSSRNSTESPFFAYLKMPVDLVLSSRIPMSLSARALRPELLEACPRVMDDRYRGVGVITLTSRDMPSCPFVGGGVRC
jgi:hypothetical protein